MLHKTIDSFELTTSFDMVESLKFPAIHSLIFVQNFGTILLFYSWGLYIETIKLTVYFSNNCKF